AVRAAASGPGDREQRWARRADRTLCPQLAAGQADHRGSRRRQGVLYSVAQPAAQLPAGRTVSECPLVDSTTDQQPQSGDYDLCSTSSRGRYDPMTTAQAPEPRPVL